MSPVTVMWRRTTGFLTGLNSTAMSTGGFLVAAGVMLAFGLETAERGPASFVSVWAMTMAKLLPFLAAALAMDVWSSERRTGRLDALLSLPVRERDLTFGKFLGAYTLLVAAMVISLVSSAAALMWLNPTAVAGLRLGQLLPAAAILALQGALWCAVTVMTSAVFRFSAASALASLALTVALPRGFWAAFLAWAPQGRLSLGAMPLHSQVADFARGSVSLGVIAVYVVLTAVALFISSKLMMYRRLTGRGSVGRRASTFFAIFLSLVFAVLASALAMRLDARFELPADDGAVEISRRTRDLLSEIGSGMYVTCFLGREDARFRQVTGLLRALDRASAAVGGTGLNLRYVDPKWDIGAAERLMALGVKENSVVFESARRLATVSVDEGFCERACVAALHRVVLPIQRCDLHWTVGHGESAFNGYDNRGMSDIARELAREGYRNLPIDLAAEGGIPAGCAAIVVAGARDDFSRAELDRLDAYLRHGGRLLVLAGPKLQDALASLLSNWGLRAKPAQLQGSATMFGTDAVVSDFTDHAISERMAGSRIVMDRPLAFEASAAAGGVAGADRIEFHPVARLGGEAVVAAVERGAKAGADLSMRPTRIVVIGDGTFAMNGSLASRANANLDFAINCVAYLSGAETIVADNDATRLDGNMDRDARRRLIAVNALVIPLTVYLVMVAIVFGRRRVK